MLPIIQNRTAKDPYAVVFENTLWLTKCSGISYADAAARSKQLRIFELRVCSVIHIE